MASTDKVQGLQILMGIAFNILNNDDHNGLCDISVSFWGTIVSTRIIIIIANNCLTKWYDLAQ